MKPTPHLLAAWFVIMLTGCLQSSPNAAAGDDTRPAQPTPRDPSQLSATAVATFAGGCFWCMEGGFEKLDGVAAVVSGYTGGHVANPTYEQVCTDTTGHAEAVQVRYDPSVVRYETLLEVFWRQIDPTDPGGQFADRGSSYRTEIFYHDEAQRQAAEKSKAALQASGRFSKPVVTPITKASQFYVAEDYHQDYYKENPWRYQRYRQGSGRAGFLEKTWGDEGEYQPPATPPTSQPASKPTSQPAGKPERTQVRYRKPSADEIRKRLTKMQYKVTQEDGTEPPFRNEYFDNKKAGIYVDIVTGEPLFSSRDKYKSGTGWPSFTRPIRKGVLTRHTDHKLGYARTEVRSKIGDSHLGHVFEDGPQPTGLRYCINSAALRFIPLDELQKEGYAEFVDDVAAASAPAE